MTTSTDADAIASALADLLDRNAGAVLVSEARHLVALAVPGATRDDVRAARDRLGLVQRRLDRNVWVWCLPDAIAYRVVQGASARRRELARHRALRQAALARIRDERRRQAARLLLVPTPIDISDPDPDPFASAVSEIVRTPEDVQRAILLDRVMYPPRDEP